MVNDPPQIPIVQAFDYVMTEAPTVSNDVSEGEMWYVTGTDASHSYDPDTAVIYDGAGWHQINITSAAELSDYPFGTGALSFDPATQLELDSHSGDTNNPHNVDDSQTGAASALSSHAGDTTAHHSKPSTSDLQWQLDGALNDSISNGTLTYNLNNSYDYVRVVGSVESNDSTNNNFYMRVNGYNNSSSYYNYMTDGSSVSNSGIRFYYTTPNAKGVLDVKGPGSWNSYPNFSVDGAPSIDNGGDIVTFSQLNTSSAETWNSFTLSNDTNAMTVNVEVYGKNF